MTDFEAVNARKHAQRTRFGLSKLVHRAKDMQQAGERLQARIAELEGIVLDSFLLASCIKNENPDAAQLAGEIIEKTGPAIPHLLEDFYAPSRNKKTLRRDLTRRSARQN